MGTVILIRFKGQFLKGNPKKCKTPDPGKLLFYAEASPVKKFGFKPNGWILPHKGAE